MIDSNIVLTINPRQSIASHIGVNMSAVGDVSAVQTASPSPVQNLKAVSPLDPVISKLLESVVDKTIGSVLGDLSDRISQQINQVVQNVADNVSRLMTQAEFAVSADIANAKIAYEEAMGKTVKDVSDEVKNVVGRLMFMLQQIEQKEVKVVAELEQTAMNLFSMLPFADKRTRFTAVSPSAVAIPLDATSVKVSMCGLFLFTTDYPPTLTVGNIPYPATGVNNNRLTFDVPVTALVPADQLTATNRPFSYTQATFSAPWGSPGWVYGMYKHEATYPVGLGVLPATPGTFTVTLNATSTSQEMQNFQSASRFISAQHRGPDIEVRETFFPTPGWKFKGTPGFTAESHIGYTALKKVEVSPTGDQCVVTVTLGGGEWKHVGRLHFHIQGQECRDVQINTPTTLTIDNLRWGDRVLVPRAANQVVQSIVFKAFDGSQTAFKAVPDSTNPFVDITVIDDDVLITAKIPSEGDVKMHAEHQAYIVQKKRELEMRAKTVEDKQKQISDQLSSIDKKMQEPILGKSIRELLSHVDGLEHQRTELLRTNCDLATELRELGKEKATLLKLEQRVVKASEPVEAKQ